MGDPQRADDPCAATVESPSGSAPAESISGQIARAQRLLGSSLAQLRESFMALANSNAAALDTEHGRQQFERAVIALQSEDTVGQLLTLTGRRAEDLERTLERARVLISEILADPDGGAMPQARQAHRDERLAALLALLDPADSGASPTVRQHCVSPGTLQLF
ncbi:MAG: hypothetical protein ACOYMX_07945 [Burkholderiales bacterium]|jgi:hypothetical protein